MLRDNGAKATFFTVGNRISGNGVDTVKREVAEGHQVATHTWDHAAGDGQSVNLSYMSAEQQREEVTKGFQAIEDATGQKPSFVMRAPGGNFPTEVWSNVEDLVVADIGWDVDTTDWKRPEASRIAGQSLCGSRPAISCSCMMAAETEKTPLKACASLCRSSCKTAGSSSRLTNL